MLTVLLLAGAGCLAGAMNSLAGGGSFVTLPSMIGAGLPSVIANASSTVALWPGTLVGAVTYFSGFRPVCGVAFWPMLLLTILGGLVGGLLLLWTPSSAFDLVLPWLLLIGTLCLAFGRRLGAALRDRGRNLRAAALAVQFVLGVYGGYFGGAVGLMMLAAWSLFGEHDLRAMQGPRMILVGAANTAALIAFIIAGAVAWPQTLAMLAGGIVGGFVGARLGRTLDPAATRAITLAATTVITLVFFVRAYL